MRRYVYIRSAFNVVLLRDTISYRAPCCMSICIDGFSPHVHANTFFFSFPDKKFELFLRKSAKTKTKAILATSPSLLASLHKDGMPVMEAMQDLSTYLKENGLRGLAVLASPSANLEALDNLLEVILVATNRLPKHEAINGCRKF